MFLTSISFKAALSTLIISITVLLQTAIGENYPENHVKEFYRLQMCNELNSAKDTFACYGRVAEVERTSYIGTLTPCYLVKLSQQLDARLVVLADEDDFPSELIGNRNYEGELAIHKISLNNDQEIFQHLLHLQESNYKVFAVFCSIACTAKILHAASLYTYTTESNFVWITYHYELVYLDINLPTQLINMDIANNIDEKNCTDDDIAKSSCTEALTNCNSDDLHGRFSRLLTTLNNVSWKPLTYPNDFSQIAENLRTGQKLQKLRVVTIKKFPYLIMNEVPPEQLHSACRLGRICKKYDTVNGTKTVRKNCCYGLEIDLLKQLENDMGFESDMYLVEDGFFGAQVNGTWNGLVADLQQHKADFALATLSLTEERSAVIDFCEPFAEENSALLTSSMENRDPFLNFRIFSAFSMRLWITVLASLFVISFLLSLIEKMRSWRGDNTYPWIESLSYLISLFVEKEIGARDPRTVTTRFVAIFIAVGMLVLISTYTAVLTADLVDTQVEYLTSGIRDPKLTEDGGALRFGLLASSSWISYFRDTQDKVLKKLYLSSNKFEYKTLQEGIELLRNGRLQAIINDEKVLKGHACREVKHHLHVTQEVVKLIGMGLAVPKNSKLMNKISDYMRLYKEDGLLEVMEKKWLKADCEAMNDDLTSSINLQAFGGAFILLCTGIVLSVLSSCGSVVILIQSPESIK